MPGRVVLQEYPAYFGSARHRMAAIPHSNAEILFSGFIHTKKGTQQKKIPSNACLIICDVKYMYTNIRTVPDLHRIGRFVLDNKKHLAIPPAVLMDNLRLLITNNVLQFGDTYWLQKVGTLMGGPPAPPWATIFFGIHKKAVLAQFRDMLQLYCCFIDDVLRICLVNPDPAKDHRK